MRVLVAGSLTRDRIQQGETRRCQIGGVVWHAATALVELGVETRVVTRAAAEDAELIDALRRAGVEVRASHSTVTTVFVNEYDAENANQRTGLRVEAAAEPIEAGHVAGALDGVDLVYLGPLHAEDISDEALAVLRDESTPPVALDVQGYTRSESKGRLESVLDPEGNTRSNRRLRSLLAPCRWIKASEGEARTISGLSDPAEAVRALADGYPATEFVVTCGIRGVYGALQKDVRFCRAEPVQVDDVTGAGDIFFASYLSQRLRGRELGDALAFATEFTAKRLAVPGRNVTLETG